MITSKQINWVPAIFLIVYQSLLLTALPFYFIYYNLSLGVMISSIVLFTLCGFSITGGYHRLFSHRSYRTHPIVEAFVLFFGAMAVQSSAFRWSYDHRLHHAHVDTDEDPYSIKKGFWYAHFLWMLEKPSEIDTKVVSDLAKNKMVQLQHKYIKLLMIGTNVLAFFLVGWMFNDYMGAFLIAVWLRMFVLHHFTWFINSLAHTWGDKPFSQEQSAVNNYVISLVTFGEGYHNYHHTFANDYRNGVRWYHFDPTKWIIWTLNKCGLAYDLKCMHADVIKKRIVLEHKNLLIEQLHSYWNATTEEMEKQVNELSERLVAQISNFNHLKEQYRQLKAVRQSKDAIHNLKTELKAVRKSIKQDWRQWSALSRQILHEMPLAV